MRQIIIMKCDIYKWYDAPILRFLPFISIWLTDISLAPCCRIFFFADEISTRSNINKQQFCTIFVWRIRPSTRFANSKAEFTLFHFKGTV